jgi:hypothetical protein
MTSEPTADWKKSDAYVEAFRVASNAAQVEKLRVTIVDGRQLALVLSGRPDVLKIRIRKGASRS